MTEFTASVTDVVGAIPHGEVLSYGEVAVRAGRKKGAGRGVGQAIDRAGAEGIRLPWWRVVSSERRIITPMNWGQREKLMEEGIFLPPSRVSYQPCLRLSLCGIDTLAPLALDTLNDYRDFGHGRMLGSRRP